jgi:phage terminase large subunit
LTSFRHTRSAISSSRSIHAKTRWFIGVAHRRAGKTVADINELVIGALKCTAQSALRLRRAAAQPGQGHRLGLSQGIHRLPQAEDQRERAVGRASGRQADQDLRGRQPRSAEGHLSRRRCARRVRGHGPDDLDAGHSARAVDRKGWACFIGTPKGKNTFHTALDEAEDDPDWTRLMLKASETGLLDAKELADARR